MNVLADFIVRVEEQYPMNIEDEELNSLLTTIRNQAREIEDLNKELTTYRLNEEHYNEEHLLREKPASPAPAPAKDPKPEKPAKAEKAPAKPRAKRAPKA
jgi:alpha-amylase